MKNGSYSLFHIRILVELVGSMWLLAILSADIAAILLTETQW